MLSRIERLDLASAMALFSACILIEVAGCAGGGMKPEAAPALQQQNLTSSESDDLSARKKIYILNGLRHETLMTFLEDGTRTSPTIIDGLNANAFPCGVVVDPNGKIYIVTSSIGGKSGTLKTYSRSGRRTEPTISVNIYGPCPLTVDANGKIYVGDAGLTRLSTYKGDGSRTRPTIPAAHGRSIAAVAVDRSGKIFLVETHGTCARFAGSYCLGWIWHNYVRTYGATGAPSNPTIDLGEGNRVQGLAVAPNGKIYVLFGGALRTYAPGGSRVTPTIWLSKAHAVAVDANGKIYVAKNKSLSLTTYNPDGSPAAPTIIGLDDPVSVAVH